ncbi:MAG TPA: DUF6600 domain-containing protein [Candidatus Eisenbacteria bacterium]|nr:DUF6600 domain-containing protein [Candidatus Eisenbacteria bacterium]
MWHPLRALALLLGLTVALVGCAATNYEQYPDSAPYDDSDADYGYFYDALSPYGAWYQVDPYGWVWTPYDVPAGWRPYTDGQWLSTSYGWTWLSDDPWGWATYHYGRWTWDSYYGWLWVPGNVWAPAWVAWRYGDGWIGWAPLPPEVGWNGYGLDYGSYDIDNISRYRWSFCDEKDFTQTRIRTVVVPRSRNVTLLKTTKDVTRYGSVDARPVEQGLTSEMLGRDLKRKIQRYEVSDAPGVGRDRAAVIRGNVVEMYRPRIEARAPRGDRTPPNVTNRPSEKQRLEDRQKARAERQRTTTDAAQKDRSEIQPPGSQMPNVQAPATGFQSAPDANATSGTRSRPPQEARNQEEAKEQADGRSQENAKWQAEAQREAEAQRREAERRDLDARIQAQRQKLQQEQQKDIKNPPAGVSREELKERHSEEQQSQKEVEKRDREELKNREELRKQWERAQEQARQQQEQRKQKQQQDDDSRQGGQQKKPFEGQNKDQQQDRGQSRQR